MRRAVLGVVVLALGVAPPAAAWTWPVQGPVLKPFALGTDPYAAGQHRGIDIGAPAGTNVRAAAGGEVSFAGTVPQGGKTVTIRTADGYSVTHVHLGSIEVARGQQLAEGAALGTVGPSGEAEHTVPYVHLGVRVAADPNGYVDPLGLLPPQAPASAPAQVVAGPAPAPQAAPAQHPPAVSAVAETAAVPNASDAQPAPKPSTSSAGISQTPASRGNHRAGVAGAEGARTQQAAVGAPPAAHPGHAASRRPATPGTRVTPSRQANGVRRLMPSRPPVGDPTGIVVGRRSVETPRRVRDSPRTAVRARVPAPAIDSAQTPAVAAEPRSDRRARPLGRLVGIATALALVASVLAQARRSRPEGSAVSRGLARRLQCPLGPRWRAPTGCQVVPQRTRANGRASRAARVEAGAARSATVTPGR